MENIIITGFEKFGDYKENTTEILKKFLPELCGYHVEYLIFPVRIFGEAEQYSQQIVKRAQEINARAIISLGMASNVHGVRIESRAINWVENKKYCLPEEQEKVVNNNYLVREYKNVDLSKWNMKYIFPNLIKNRLCHEPQISTDAGTFCCNALIFRTLVAMTDKKCEIPYIFLHLPCTENASHGFPGFSKKNHIIYISEARAILEIFANAII